MSFLRRNLFRIWLLCSLLWLTAVCGAVYEKVSVNLFAAWLIAIILLLIGLRLAPTWEFFVSYWLGLPERVRRGLTRLYIVVSVPWTALFGYHLLDVLYLAHLSYRDRWHSALDALWLLVTVPIGAPIVMVAVLWVIAGFGRAAPASTTKEEGDSNPPNPWGRPAKEETPAGLSFAAARTKHYYAIIEHAVSQLENKDSQSREALYAKARTVLDQKLQGQPEWDQEKKALETAIREFEGFKKYIHEFAVEPGPPSTAGLILSMYFFKVLWIMDVTLMSLYWVARLPKPSK
jgi:hypothetical protein